MLRLTLDIAAWGAVAVGLFGVALHFADTQQRWAVLLTAGAPYLMCAALIGVVLFVGMRQWVSAAVALLVVAGALYTQLPPYIGEDSRTDGHRLTVMQTNVFYGNGDPHAVVSEVLNSDVDVLIVSELTPTAVAGLRQAGLDTILRHHYVEPDPQAAGMGIWARYPLHGNKKYDEFTLLQLSSTIAHPSIGDVGVYAFHPIPPFVDINAWSTEIQRINDILLSAESPAVVGADFNATRDHAAFRKLVRGQFSDAADQAGAGRVVTYPSDRRFPPLIGIDYVLVAGGAAEQVHTVTIPRSDHRAVVARLRIA